MEQEISKDGAAADFWNELKGPRESVNLDEFLRWTFAETKG